MVGGLQGVVFVCKGTWPSSQFWACHHKTVACTPSRKSPSHEGEIPRVGVGDFSYVSLGFGS